ncbi:hypothetical protein [Streptomyces chattanoogensis]|uniref:hypothetical protein n=1 Tax=Streptomyces chattanoogensis TaxID=66876 RepID=UPI0036AB730D
MGFDPNEIVTVELDCVGWHAAYTRDITRHQLGELLLKLDDMAEGAVTAPEWPTPEQAYIKAPSISSESEWTKRTADEWHDELDREWYLRHAALLDRMALHDDPEQQGAVTEDAEAVATGLLDMDRAPRHYDARAYVRQQYALWAAEQPYDPWGTSK